MKIGLQLYSIREIIDGNIPYALELAGKAGYDGVEFAGFGGLTAAQLKNELAKNGLVAAGAHIGMEPFREDFEGTLKYAVEAGLQTICVPWASVDDSYEGWANLGKEMDKIGAKLRKNGILFGYHNHSHEFKKFEGKYAIEILLENSSPENVFFEMDTMWAHKGGVDPAAFIKTYAGRAHVLHAKDEDTEGMDTEAGTGIFDFVKIADAAKADWLVVEQEAFKIDMIESIGISARTLKGLFAK